MDLQEVLVPLVRKVQGDLEALRVLQDPRDQKDS